jgi:hypothetical protein
MWGRGVIGGIMLAGIVSACAVVDPVDGRYDTIGRSLAKARNDSIFLNIVRSAHDYPLSFTTIGSVSPSMANTSTLGMPSFLVGPNPQCKAFAGAVGSAACLAVPGSPARDVIFGNANNATNALQVSSSFNISTQETAAFYGGFLKPVDLATLDYFIRQGYPRELLFWMFMDSFQIGPLGFQFNPPYDYGCPQQEPKKRCFREFVELATIAGLTVETKTVDADKGGKGQKVYSRFCFDPILGLRAVSVMKQVNNDRWVALQPFRDRFLPSPICRSAWAPESTSSGETDTLTFKVGPYPFIIQPRSAFSMFQFLGTIIKMQKAQQEDADPSAVYVPRDYERDPPNLSTVSDDQFLFTVSQNYAGECFAHTWFNDGDYCVPETATNTKRIFSMLAQLIAIQTQSSDLSITPAVRIIP